MVQNYLTKGDICVPVYPKGGYYGYERGFPPKRPDLNIIAESLIGEVKYRCAMKIYQETNDPLTYFAPTAIAKHLHDCFDSIPQSFVHKQFDKLKRIMMETIECNGAYGPTATNTLRKKRRHDDEILDEKSNDTASESDSDWPSQDDNRSIYQSESCSDEKSQASDTSTGEPPRKRQKIH
jgi:hypothetical protein